MLWQAYTFVGVDVYHVFCWENENTTKINKPEKSTQGAPFRRMQKDDKSHTEPFSFPRYSISDTTVTYCFHLHYRAQKTDFMSVFHWQLHKLENLHFRSSCWIYSTVCPLLNTSAITIFSTALSRLYGLSCSCRLSIPSISIRFWNRNPIGIRQSYWIYFLFFFVMLVGFLIGLWIQNLIDIL